MESTTSAPDVATLLSGWDIMISHQFTDMDLEQQTKRSAVIKGALPDDSNVFCSLEHEDYLKEKFRDDIDAIYDWCLAQQRYCKTVVFLIAPGPKSTGMIKELNQAIASRQDIVVCVHTDMADKTWVQRFTEVAVAEIEWSGDQDLALVGTMLDLTRPKYS